MIVYLYPQNNAASTITEGNSVGTWVGDGNSSVYVDTVTNGAIPKSPANGTYCIGAVVDTALTESYVSFPLEVVSGQSYRVIMSVARGTTWGGGRILGWTGFVTSPSISIGSEAWSEKIMDVEANITGTAQIKIRTASSTGVIGDTLWIDKITIDKI